MNRYLLHVLRLLRINSIRHVILYTLLCTAFTVAVPVAVVYFSGSLMLGVSGKPLVMTLMIAGLIPLFISLPLSFILLSMLHLITAAIEQVDNHVKLDPLTGLLTRKYFFDQIQRLAGRDGVFLMIDADHFKAINDTYGHHTGDAALCVMAEAIVSVLPANALAARLGGEELGVFLPGMQMPDAVSLSSAILSAIRRQGAVIEHHPIGLTVSIGGAVHERRKPLDDTIKAADARLYHAKRSGRDRAVFAGEAGASMFGGIAQPRAI